MSPDQERERGSAMVMALAFIVAVGGVTLALLSQASANFRTTTVTRALQDRIAAANAGLDTGIQVVRASAAPCSTLGQDTTLRVLAVNGRTVTVTCRMAGGYGTGVNGWAVFIADPAGKISNQSGQPKTIDGPVYVANPGGAAAWDLTKEIEVTNGDVYQVRPGCVAGSAPTPVKDLKITPPSQGVWCLPSALPVPAANLPPLPSPAAIPQDPQGDGGTSCRVFSPGLYTSPPVLADRNYFKSGVYVFNGIGTWTIDRQEVVGGQPTVGDSQQTGAIPCNGEPPTPGQTAPDGVSFVLAGNSAIVVTNQTANLVGTLELHAYTGTPRPIGAAVPAPFATIYQVQSGDGTGFPASTVTRQSGQMLLMTGSTGGSGLRRAEISIHGPVHAPTGIISIEATTDSARAKYIGGIVAGEFRLQASGSTPPGALEISVRTSAGERTVLLTSTVDQRPGEKPISARALLTVANDANRTTNIQSWTVNNP